MNLLTLMVHGPLTGATKRNPTLAHAITTEAFIEAGAHKPGKRKVLVTAPCGAKHVRFVCSEGDDGQVFVAPWPIRADGPLTRCRECWVATGKKRPRSDLGRRAS